MFRLNWNKQKTYPNSLKESIFGYFSENLGLFRFVCYETVSFGYFDIGSKHRNKQKYMVFGFTKQTETNAKQILFRFVSVRTEIYFCLFRGHPIAEVSYDMSSLKDETRGFLANSVCWPFSDSPLKFVRATLFLKCQFGTPKNCQHRTQLRLRYCYIRVVFFINRKRRDEVSAPLELAARVSGEPQGPLLLLHTTPLTMAQWIFSTLLEIRFLKPIN
jgi:hypothetical protein